MTHSYGLQSLLSRDFRCSWPAPNVGSSLTRHLTNTHTHVHTCIHTTRAVEYNNSMLPSPTMQYPQHSSALHSAVTKGDRNETLAALEHIDQLEERSRSMTPLQSAAHLGHYDLLPLLLTGGAQINAAPSELGCVIQVAISSVWHGGIPDKISLRAEEQIREKKVAQTEAVSFLLEHGADPIASGGEFGSPIVAAAAYGNADIVKLLLARDADPNSPGGRLGFALQAACAQGGMPVGWSVSCALPDDYHEVQEILLRSGAQVNRVGGIYGTALEAAAFLGDTGTIYRLLEKRADPNIRAGRYGSALGAAAVQGHLSVVKRLLEAGARTKTDPAVKPHPHDDWYRWTSEPISSLLLKYGAPLPSATISIEEQAIPDLESPFALANGRGHSEVVRMLSDNGI